MTIHQVLKKMFYHITPKEMKDIDSELLQVANILCQQIVQKVIWLDIVYILEFHRPPTYYIL